MALCTLCDATIPEGVNVCSNCERAQVLSDESRMNEPEEFYIDADYNEYEKEQIAQEESE